jgi:hypothetical protein
LNGKTFQYEVGGPLDDIGFWTDPNDWADWSIKVNRPGKFAVVAVIGAPASSPFDVVVVGQTIHCTGPATANYIEFKLAILGTIDVPTAGKTTLAVKPNKESWQPMNLKSITLIPTSAANP